MRYLIITVIGIMLAWVLVFFYFVRKIAPIVTPAVETRVETPTKESPEDLKEYIKNNHGKG